MIMKFWVLFIAVAFCAVVCNAQIEGVVSDEKDNETLPFTHVYNLSTDKGVYTDINGGYRIEANTGDVLQFSYVGYEIQKVIVGKFRQLNVKLRPSGYTLSEVQIRPGVNPAHRIIRHVIANREKNNPDKRPSYSCVLYNKLIVEAITDSTSVKPAQYNKMADTSTFILMNEAVVRREYKYKDNVNEEIISSQTSGFREYQQMASLQLMIQPFHFYHDVVIWKISEKFYLNPICPGSISKYSFLLRDAIVSENADTTFIISYQPRLSSNFEGLKGLLYINSRGWAIQSIVAEPADFSPIRLKIQQQYARMDSVWFPSELSFELFMYNVAYSGLDMVYRGKSSIKDVDLAPDLSSRTFTSRNITLADDAWKKNELIDLHRNAELSAREDSTFKRLEKFNGDIIFQIMEGAMDNQSLSAGIFNFPFERIIQQNYFEGFRLGLGVFTNRRLSPWFSAGGYYGYGLKDRRSKYGASFSIFPEKNLDSEIKFLHDNELQQLTYMTETGVSARRLFGRFDILADFKIRKIQTTFDYSFDGQNLLAQSGRNSEAGLQIRYAQNEERIILFRRTQTIFNTQPVVYLNLYWGIPDCFGNQYAYFKTEASIGRSWYIRNIGHIRFTVRGGWMSNDVPFPLTFTVTDVEQSWLFYPSLSAAKFNALTGNAYSASQYFNVFLYHNFGTLLGKTHSKIFLPRISVAQSFGWSKLNRPELHASSDPLVCDMHRGYFESGLIVEDIIRIKYLNLFFFGLGGGVYGAYGVSVQKPFMETLTPKIRITATF